MDQLNAQPKAPEREAPQSQNEPSPAIPPVAPAAPPYAAGPYAAYPEYGTPVPVQPVVVGRSHRLRWAVVGGVVLIVALVTAAGAFVLSGASGSKSLTASVAPENTAMFVELRTDLPGDQHQKLADFMSHFPGFADRAQFDNALDEMFNRVTRSVSADLAYTSAFKPWIEGEVSIAVMPGSPASASSSLAPQPTLDLSELPSDVPLPSDFAALMGTSGMSLGPTMDAVVIVQVKDRGLADAWITSELSQNKISPNSASYDGETIYSFPSDGQDVAYVLTNQDLVIGTVAGVKASLDTKTKGSLADSATYQTAMKSLNGDSLARFYVDPRSLYGGELSMMGSMQQMFGGTPGPTFDLTSLPGWVAGSVRAESDRLVMEATTAGGNAGLGNHASQLAPVLPGSTVAVAEYHSIGKMVGNGIDKLTQMAPSLGMDASSIHQVQQALSLIGGVDWIQDGAIAVTDENGKMGGGLVIQTPDPSTAQSKLGMINGFASLAGSAAGISSKTEQYNGHTITILTMQESAGSDSGIALNSSVEIGLTTKDNFVVAGVGDEFAKAMIDTTSSNALATQSDYKTVMDAVGSSNAMSFYVNVPAIEDQIGKAAVSQSDWNLNYKPYFDHFGGFGYAVTDGTTSTERIVLLSR